MHIVSGFVAAIAIIYSGSVLAAPLVQGSYVLEQFRLGSEIYDANEFLTKQFQQGMQDEPGMPKPVAFQLAFVFEGNDVTAHSELLTRDDSYGYVTCTSQVTLAAEWQGSLFTIPVTSRSQHTFRNITNDGGSWVDKGDIGCGGGLNKGDYQMTFEGDLLIMKGPEGPEFMLRRDTNPFMSYREFLPPPK